MALRGAFTPAALALLLCFAALCQAQDTSAAFPCPSEDSNAPTPAGGYQNIETINSEEEQDNLLGAINASFVQFVSQDSENSICNDTDNIVVVEIAPLQACSQVVAGTNYGLKYAAKYSCDVDADTLGSNRVVLNAVVFQPLPTDQNAEPTFEVQSVSRDKSFTASQTITDVEPAEAAPEAAPAAAPTDAEGNPTGNLGSFNFPGLRKLKL